jgi:pectate lyase
MHVVFARRMMAALCALTTSAAGQTAGVLTLHNDTGPSSVIEGYGVSTQGGAGGQVYRVTSLADSGPGSLRDAVLNRTGPRIVVFDVGGTITLQSDIFIQTPFLTVDGSSAPSPGITVKRATLQAGQFVICGTHDIILRHLRLQGLYEVGGPLINGGGTLVIDGDTPPDGHAHHIVLDHLTCCNATDGGPDIWGNVSDVTLSWSFIYHNRHPTSVSHTDVPYQPRRRISMHHNVFARNGERNPQVRADTREMDIVNNVIYEYGFFGAGNGHGMRIRNVPGEPQVSCNIINNYFAPTVVPEKALIYGGSPGPDAEDGGPFYVMGKC